MSALQETPPLGGLDGQHRRSLTRGIFGRGGGFEPPTPWSRTRCSYQAEPLPDEFVSRREKGGGTESRASSENTASRLQLYHSRLPAKCFPCSPTPFGPNPTAK